MKIALKMYLLLKWTETPTLQYEGFINGSHKSYRLGAGLVM